MGNLQVVNKPVLHIKRQGRVCTVYVDPLTDLPLSAVSFEDGPVGGFPKIMDEQEVATRYSHKYAVVPFDPPHADPPEAPDVVDEATLQRVQSEEDRRMEAYRRKNGITTDGRIERLKGRALPVPPQIQVVSGAAPATEPQSTGYISTVQPLPQPGVPQQQVDRVFQELETMFAKRSVAAGKLKKELSTEINAVCNFLARIAPEITTQLKALSEKHRNVERIEF